MSEVIKIEHLTKDYGNNRGVFDLSFSVNKGEVFGIVGTNGSGKTTIIRHIMGFLKPQSGKVTVLGLDAWEQSYEIKKYVEYIPGEIAFPDLRDGTTFLKNQAELLGKTNLENIGTLVDKLQLDTSANLKRMSKGMKQKTAIVAAFMADKDILILDEPSTGLDPLMRETFIELLSAEKAKGRTILMSSQMFDELEGVCDRVALLLDGHIVEIADMKKLHNLPYTTYKIEFNSKEQYLHFKTLKFQIVRDQEQYNQVTINIQHKNINILFNVLKNYDVKFIAEVTIDLEKHFKSVLSVYKMKQERDKLSASQHAENLQQLSQKLENHQRSDGRANKKTIKKAIKKEKEFFDNERQKIELQEKNDKFFTTHKEKNAHRAAKVDKRAKKEGK